MTKNKIPVNKLTINDCRESARKRGGKCLSKKYIDIFHKIKWQCSKGHIWESAYTNIRNKNRWCPECAGRRNIDLDMCKKVAASKNGKCLSRKYVNARTNMKWKCDKGHIWETTSDKVLNRGDWCPKCRYIIMSKKMTLTNGLDLAKDLAIKNGGKCLSKKYTNNSSKMLWQCEKGHIWKTSYNHVRSGKWCPNCSNGKSQNILANIIKKIFNDVTVLQNYTGFDWLKYKRKMEIDIWVPELKLAIEYDGQQHFHPVQFGGITKKAASKVFNKTKRRDARKDHLIRQHKNEIKYFVRFSYKEEINKDYVIKKLKKMGIKEQI